MTVQLLLVLALVGPFCAFTHASPTVMTTEPDTGTPETTYEQHTTLIAAETSMAPFTTEDSSTTEMPLTTAEVTPSAASGLETVSWETDSPFTLATTIEPKIQTTTPSGVDNVSTQLEPISETSEVETTDHVVVEEDVEEGMSSGQVGGIVIGALVAVVIVIAVVIAVVRRMGKYSP